MKQKLTIYSIDRVKNVINWMLSCRIIKSRRDVAEKMNYKESSLSQILTGRVPCSEKFIQSLCYIEPRINKKYLEIGNEEAPMLNNIVISDILDKSVQETDLEAYLKEKVETLSSRIVELERENAELKQKLCQNGFIEKEKADAI